MLWWLLWAILFATVGGALGKPYGTEKHGTLWGFLLGPVGLLCWWVQNRNIAPFCPECTSVVPAAARRCRSCHAEIEPAIQVQPGSLPINFGLIGKLLGVGAAVVALVVGVDSWLHARANRELNEAAARVLAADAEARIARAEAAKREAERRQAERESQALEAAPKTILQRIMAEAAARKEEARRQLAEDTARQRDAHSDNRERREQFLADRQQEEAAKPPPVVRLSELSPQEACQRVIARDLTYPLQALRLRDRAPPELAEHAPNGLFFSGGGSDYFVCELTKWGGYTIHVSIDGAVPFRQAARGVL